MSSSSKQIDFTLYKGSKGGSIVKSTTHHGPLEKDQVLVKVTHSGLCGTDEHYRHKDQGLGHEGAGVVQEIGPDVQTLKIGDNVGWGYIFETCGHCQQCLTGKETFCPSRVMYGSPQCADQGSFATHSVWREAYLFRIPSSIKNEDAAPLMCGGATVFTCLDMYDIRPTHRVGIIGVGGLGHLAIQFASKWGCEVVVFSGTESKKEEALKLGAKEFYATKGLKELKVKAPIDHLLVTTSFKPDWNLYMNALAPEATIYPLSVADGDFAMPYMPLLAYGLRVQGSLVAPRAIHNRMLEFAAFHQIKPMIEKYPMGVEGITEAMQNLNDGKVRYRAVLVAQD